MLFGAGGGGGAAIQAVQPPPPPARAQQQPPLLRRSEVHETGTWLLFHIYPESGEHTAGASMPAQQAQQQQQPAGVQWEGRASLLSQPSSSSAITTTNHKRRNPHGYSARGSNGGGARANGRSPTRQSLSRRRIWLPDLSAEAGGAVMLATTATNPPAAAPGGLFAPPAKATVMPHAVAVPVPMPVPVTATAVPVTESTHWMPTTRGPICFEQPPGTAAASMSCDDNNSGGLASHQAAAGLKRPTPHDTGTGGGDGTGEGAYFLADQHPPPSRQRRMWLPDLSSTDTGGAVELTTASPMSIASAEAAAAARAINIQSAAMSSSAQQGWGQQRRPSRLTDIIDDDGDEPGASADEEDAALVRPVMPHAVAVPVAESTQWMPTNRGPIYFGA